jgi:hypothetical protein
LHQKGFATHEKTIDDEEFCYKHFRENISSKPSNDLQIMKKKMQNLYFSEFASKREKICYKPFKDLQIVKKNYRDFLLLQ